MATKEIIDAYMAAWNEPDEGKRRELLAKAWADGATYTDPMAHAAGIEELVSLIGQFQGQMPGATLVRVTGIDEHHGRLRFGWAMKGPDGGTRIEGIDVGELGEDGRIKSITGFFGPMPLA